MVPSGSWKKTGACAAIDVPEAAMGRYAFGYSRTDDSPVRVNPGMLDAEAYGIKSSVTDMTRFLDAHLGNLALADEMTAALARTRVSEFETAHYAQAMIWEGYPWPVDASKLGAGNSAEMAMTPQPVAHHAPRDLDGEGSVPPHPAALYRARLGGRPG